MLSLLGDLMVSVSSSTSAAVAGDSVILTCSVTLPDGLTGSPEFQWEGPGDTPYPAPSSTSGQEVTSQLTLSAIRLSQAGQYTCTASLSDFTASKFIAVAVSAAIPAADSSKSISCNVNYWTFL